jgi:sterol desaturase/sphingolipid hydroxylase (fatty acid hydroxylase superfamily)
MATPDFPISLHLPIIPQLLALPCTLEAKDAFVAWQRLHIPGRLTLFTNTMVESLTFTPWYGPLLAWTPVIVGLLSLIILPSDLTLFRVCNLTLIGVLLWSLIEWTLHRFLFHMDAFMLPSPFLYTIQFLLHGVHHKTPADELRLVFPPLGSLSIGALIAVFLRTIVLPASLLSTPEFAAVFVGGSLGYLGYEIIHYSTHHIHVHKYLEDGGSLQQRLAFLFSTPIRVPFLILQRLHMRHHIAHVIGFGVSSPLWDIVFGTTAWPQNMAAVAAHEAWRAGGGGVAGKSE